jgi:transposase
MLTLNLDQAEIQRLNYERFHYPCPMVQKRLHAVYLKAVLGASNQHIGLLCDLHPNSVAHWVKAYRQQGFEVLTQNRYGTNASQLDGSRQSILESLQAQPPHSANQAVARIEELTGLRRSPCSVRRWMHKQGLRFRRLGHVPAKADPDKQQQGLEQDFRPHLERARQGLCHLFFLDAAHFVLGPFLCAVWCLARLFVRAPAGRQRLNVVGAVHALTKQVVSLTNTSFVDAHLIAAFLGQLREQFSDLPLVIVLDNARYQRCTFIQQLAGQLGITLLFLPPYSPNLNLIERLWKLVKKKCLYAQYYSSFAAFSTAIENCLDTLQQDELETCLTLKFQTFQKSQFYPV